MAVTTIFTGTNLTLPSAPAEYFLPDPGTQPNGVAVPAGGRNWQLLIDQTNVPSGSTYSFEMQLKRNTGWTDNAGVVHPAGEWLGEGADVLSGGVMPKGGFINNTSSEINQIPNAPYPDRGRIRVLSWNTAWVLPSLKINVIS